MSAFGMLGKETSTDKGVAEFLETDGAVLLDVRTPEEYQQGHIPQSINIPLDHLNVLSYPAETPLYVYCHSGQRAGQACTWLKQQGYLHVTDIGGIVSFHGSLE